MRHGKKFNHLSRTHSHRKAMLMNMACSLIQHKRIKTTVAKAKALRVYVEPLITKAKNDTTHNRRVVFSYLNDKETIKELFGDVASKIGNRPGGYTRILKIGNRAGDNAEMALIELVDFNELAPGKIAGSKSKSRRRRGSKKSAGTKAAAETKVEEVVETVEDTATEAAAAVTEVAEETVEVVEETTEEVVAEATDAVEEATEDDDAKA